MADLRIEPPLLFTAATILPPICTAVVAARFVARKVQKTKLGLDDWLVIPALVTVYGIGITIIIGTAQRALGYPTPKVPAAQVLTAASWQQVITEKCYFTTTLLQTASLTFSKLSVLLFYNRIFGSGLRRIVKLTIYTMILLILIWGVVFFFVFFFTCGKNVDHLWNSTADALTCPLTLTSIDLALSITDVIMDVFILIFPIPLILQLHMSMVHKIAVLGIFMLGALAIAASITRLVILKEELSVYVQSTADEDFVATDILYFMHIEASVALIAINLPSMAGFFKIKQIQNLIAGFKSLLSSSGRSNKSNDSQIEESSRKQNLDWMRPVTQSRSASQAQLFESHVEAQPHHESGNTLGEGKIQITNTVTNRIERRH